MPNVLFVCEYATLNGGEQSLLAWLPHLQQAGWSAAVACPPQGPFIEVLKADGVETVAWFVDGSLQQKRAALRKIIEAHRPDILHANSLSMSRLAGPVAAPLQIPSIGHLRDILRLSPQAVADVNLHTRILAVSQAAAQWHIDQGVNAELVHVLYNGVDLRRFHPRTATGYLHREREIPERAPLVVNIGQIGMRKGQDVLLAAANGERAAASVADAHFLIIGERNSAKDEAIQFEQSLRDAADRPPLRGRVHFLGRRDDIARLLNEATLLVHSARQEPLGRVLLEAAASGTPIIATDVGGTPEIFPPGSGAALLVPPDNPTALADAIHEMLTEDSLRQSCAVSARRRAEENFDIRDSSAELIAHYAGVLG